MKKEIYLRSFQKEQLNECVDLFIDTFSKEPWNDTYDSREQVVTFFENHMKNNYFLGYLLMKDHQVVALSIGAKKPWMEGMEYYIDQFCVDTKFQGQGIGSQFLKLIEEDIRKNGMNAIMLNTERGFPSEKFYIKNGFKILEELIILAK